MNTNTLVLDASCVAKLLIEESGTAAYRQWHFQLLSSGSTFRAPHLLQYEVGRALQRARTDATAAQKGSALADAMAAIDLQAVSTGGPFERAADLSYYDAAYVALAAETTSGLVTYDRKMADVGRSSGLWVWDGPLIGSSLDPGFRTWLLRIANDASTKAIAKQVASDKCLNGGSCLDIVSHGREAHAMSEPVAGLGDLFQAFARESRGST